MIRQGYKQTEVGVIPEDWDVVSLGSCLSDWLDYGINAPAVPYSDKLSAYIRITDITEDGRFMSDKPVSVKSVLACNYFLSEGDIVFARTGASVGKSYRYNLSDGPLVFAGFLIRARHDITKLLPAFVASPGSAFCVSRKVLIPPMVSVRIDSIDPERSRMKVMWVV